MLSQVDQPLRPQPAQRQRAQGRGRGPDLVRQGAALRERAPVRLGDQRAHRQDRHLREQGADGRSPDGVGLPADAVPERGDRRRALLGRRLLGQSGALPAVLRNGERRHCPRADQSDRAQGDAALGAGDPEPADRDQLQRRPAARIARRRFRDAADRRRQAVEEGLQARPHAPHRRRQGAEGLVGGFAPRRRLGFLPAAPQTSASPPPRRG